MKKGILILLFAVFSFAIFILERYLFNGITFEKPLYISYLISFSIYFIIYLLQLKYCKSISPRSLGLILLLPQILVLILVVMDRNLHFRVPSIYPIVSVATIIALFTAYFSDRNKKQKVAFLLSASLLGAGLYYNLLVVPTLFNKGLNENDTSLKFSEISFSLVNDKGERIESNRFKDKTMLIEFWFKDCLPCRQKMKVLNDLREHFNQDTNLVFITINSGKIDSYSAFKEAVDDKPYNNFINLYDSAGIIADKFKIGSFPEEVIIHKMKPIRVFKGWYSMDLSEKYSKETKNFLNQYIK